MAQQSKQGRPNLYEKVKIDITKSIESKDLSSPQKLDSEKMLCERYGVSRPVVRRALKELADEGMILSIPGRGHFVVEKTSVEESGIVTVIIGATGSRHGLDSPHIVKLLRGIENTLFHSRFKMVWESVGSGYGSSHENPKPGIDNLKGAILVPLGRQTGEEMVRTLPPGIKCVVVGRSSWMDGIPSVQADHAAGSRLAVEYLVRNSHKVIGCVAESEDHPVFNKRLAAYKDALAESGLVSSPELSALCPISSMEHAEQIIAKMIRNNPSMSAIWVGRALLLPACLSALQNEKKGIPEDISLVCCDASAIHGVNIPSMPNIRQPSEEMGQLAAKMLLRLLDGEEILENKVVLPTELVIRP